MMFFTKLISVLFVLCVTSSQNINNYVVPKVTVQALKPNGFRIYIPGDSRIKLFHFEANFYSSNKQFYKSIREFVVEETEGYWMYEDQETPLQVGDTVVYYVYVSFKRGVTDIYHWDFKVPGYTGRGQHRITKEDIKDKADLFELSLETYNETCKRTVTKLLNGEACSGQTIFEDHFDTFRDDLWQIEQYIPEDDQYHPFISYQNNPSDPTVFVKDGLLNLQPKLPKIITDYLIVGGKLTAKLAFTYGIVEIRAKMPIGDWIYPEMHLRSFTNKYGKLNYSSGVLKIASVFGNEGSNDTYNNKFLGGSVLLNTKCFPLREPKKKISNGTWSDDFHVFSLKWTPDFIEHYVDGVMWSRVRPGRKGLRAWLPQNCRKDWFELLGTGGKMAPFDHHFFLSLGVAVGGTIFPDNITGTVAAKPWRNEERKALLHFWNDVTNWYRTWTQPLLIDYVKISAL